MELTNELLFFMFLLGGLSLALFSHYLGKGFVYALIITITIYINIAEAKVIDIFGYATTLGTVLFGVMYLATDMLTERYGKEAGFTAVKLGIFSAILFQLFMQLTLMAQVIPDDPGSTFFADFAGAMDGVFTISLRITLAGLFVYAISQSFDIWLFQKIKDASNGKYLWLRNNGSTFTSQALDTYLFTFLAFYGNMPTPVIIEMATVGYVFKLIVAFSDTPFMYASKLFTPRDLKTASIS